MTMDAGHPNYEDAEGIDDLDVPASGGNSEYPGINMDSILGVPFYVVNARARESRTENAKPGDHYVIIDIEFAADMPKKFAIGKAEDSDPIPVRIGAKASVLTGGYYIVPKIDAMFAKRNLGEDVPFDPPFGPVMFAKRGSGKARDLVGAGG